MALRSFLQRIVVINCGVIAAAGANMIAFETARADVGAHPEKFMVACPAEFVQVLTQVQATQAHIAQALADVERPTVALQQEMISLGGATAPVDVRTRWQASVTVLQAHLNAAQESLVLTQGWVNALLACGTAGFQHSDKDIRYTGPSAAAGGAAPAPAAGAAQAALMSATHQNQLARQSNNLSQAIASMAKAAAGDAAPGAASGAAPASTGSSPHS